MVIHVQRLGDAIDIARTIFDTQDDGIGVPFDDVVDQARITRLGLAFP